MSAKLMWPIDEEPIQARQDELTTQGQSRRELEHEMSLMLLEAVACLRELSEIVLRHERVLKAENWASSTERAGAPAPIPLRQPHDLEDDFPASEANKSSLSITGHNCRTVDPVSERKALPASFSFLLSAVASVSGLGLVYVLFLR